MTYAEFNAYVNRLAHGLAGRGYERGAALALASGNSADFLAVYYALGIHFFGHIVSLFEGLILRNPKSERPTPKASGSMKSV